ncbi:MAG: acetylxylan esterase [Armatimonadetes bacterium]|nr:acetylxylan esterase [Armatimonadota bacterium]
MPSIDYPLAKLIDYQPPLTRQPDFEEFWGETLAEARQHDLSPLLEFVEHPIDALDVRRLNYAGFGGHRVHGLYLRPRTDERTPVVVVYHGYSGGAGEVHMHLPWLMLGCAVVAVDTRGQGGDTGDPGGYSGGSTMGWMTQGLLDPHEYYYRRAYTDCVRAIDFACSRDELDTSRLAILGGSQGGGLTLAVAGLDSRVRVAMPDVPFLCHFERAIDITANGPYLELQRYLARYPQHTDTALRTLSYFDGMNLAAGIDPGCRMLWSVGLWDDVCPPSTVFAAYNHCPVSGADGRKEMAIYPYNKHEGGGPAQRERQIAYLKNALTLPF